MWEVIVLDNVVDWYREMDDGEATAFEAAVSLVERHGPMLRYPFSSSVKGARHGLRELRYQHRGAPYRVLYAFDPRRQAVLLIGGNKGGDGRWYERNVPTAERLFDAYLNDLED